MHSPRILLALVVVAAVPLWACGGGGCRYADTPGTASILSVETPPTGENACPRDPVQVTFRFTPTDASLPVTASFALTIGDGKHPPRAWVTASGLGVGTVHPAVRSRITEGTCTPLIIVLTDVDHAAANAACF